MVFESVFQQDVYLFQAEQRQSAQHEHSVMAALSKRNARAAYQQMTNQTTEERTTAQFDTRIGVESPQDGGGKFKSQSEISEEERFGLKTEEQARALLLLARFDQLLNRMIEEQQPLSTHDVRSAYRRILKQYHPDQSRLVVTGAVIQQANIAYATLRPLL